MSPAGGQRLRPLRVKAAAVPPSCKRRRGCVRKKGEARLLGPPVWRRHRLVSHSSGTCSPRGDSNGALRFSVFLRRKEPFRNTPRESEKRFPTAHLENHNFKTACEVLFSSSSRRYRGVAPAEPPPPSPPGAGGRARLGASVFSGVGLLGHEVTCERDSRGMRSSFKSHVSRVSHT